ncbi:bifunctional adenosylcobinamide kinase/adenosylcobinamide-phosphate guanylyltransferase [Acuticoccus sp.]|uniref:bifunctional adenosylcobinamide kinase/adenosylcobinamide-phosphate guanylyltransferase n=1 Tax=Acuticoccus sp. TaxID=1904378 RepID=UPI003B5263F2
MEPSRGQPQFVLVLGGARSGKSRFAEALAAGDGRPVTYVATAGPPRDREMERRIAEHRARRPAAWRTHEVTVDLAPALGTGVVLVDCLTLWLTHLVLGDEDVAAHTERLLAAIAARRGPVIAVANEVGEGIVPATPLGRDFRDRQGVLNQRMAVAATTVVKMVAGCPLVVKPAPAPSIVL